MQVNFKKLGSSEQEIIQAEKYGIRYTKSQKNDLRKALSIKNPSEQDLVEFEKSRNLILPSEYRSFLKNVNGGVPDKKIFNLKDNEYTVDIFLLMAGNSNIYDSIENYMRFFQSRIPINTIPFARSPGGDLFLIGVDNKIHGNIFYWQHEFESQGNGNFFWENLISISNRFNEFIEGLE